MLRIRRRLPPQTGRRGWLLEVEVEVPAIDPERILADCRDFLVDGNDGRKVGVVDRVERSDESGLAVALLVSEGWFGRRLLRVEAEAVEMLVPQERRLIVDPSRVCPVEPDDRPR